MITVDQIRAELQKVIREETSLDAFDEWFAQASWNMHLNSTPDAIRLASMVELCLAEFDGGFLSETNLFAELRNILSAEPQSIRSNYTPQREMAAASGQ